MHWRIGPRNIIDPLHAGSSSVAREQLFLQLIWPLEPADAVQPDELEKFLSLYFCNFDAKIFRAEGKMILFQSSTNNKCE